MNWTEQLRHDSNFKTNRAQYLCIGIMIAAVISCCAGCRTRSEAKSLSPDSNSANTAAQIATYRFAQGRTLVYHIKYTSESSTNLNSVFAANSLTGGENQSISQGASPSSFETNIEGTLSGAVLELKPEGAIIAYRLTDANFSVNGEGAIFTGADAIKADLMKPMFALVDLLGRIQSVRFDSDVDYSSQTFGRTLLGITQFVFPNSPGSNLHQWESQEDDPAGQYTAGYLAKGDTTPIDPHKGVVIYKKVKTKYIEAAQKRVSQLSGTAQITRTIEPNGGFSVEFDFGAGRVKSFQGTETQDVVRGGKQIGLATNSVRLEFAREESIGSNDLLALAQKYADLERTTTAVPLSATPSDEMRRKAIETNTLGDSTLTSLLSELKAAEQSDKNPNTTQLYLKMKALIYLHPETCQTFGQMLTTAPPNSLTMNLVARALGAASSPQSQAAIVTAIKAHPNDEAIFSTLSFILARSKSPTLQAENTLAEFAFAEPETDIVKTAQLMLGAMARNIDESDPQRAARLVDHLIEHLGASSSPNVLRRLLSVLGNAGSTEAMPTIKRFLDDPSPDLRGGAAYALRWVDSGEADDLLSAIIVNDSEASVRIQGLSALSYRDLNAKTFDAMKRVFLSDKAENARLAALKNLWTGHEAFPEVVQIVKRAGAMDDSKEVRKAASELIADYKAPELR